MIAITTITTVVRSTKYVRYTEYYSEVLGVLHSQTETTVRVLPTDRLPDVVCDVGGCGAVLMSSLYFFLESLRCSLISHTILVSVVMVI
jgi:hypothetical protein